MTRFTALISILAVEFVLSIALAATSQKPGLVPAPGDTTNVHDNVLYANVSGSELHLDIYEPVSRDNGPRPAVLLLHGGGWTSYDKSTMRGMGEFLARSGFVAFAADYRLFQAPATNRWPAQLDDVQRAVRWIRANADKYDVDRERIGAWGHSAGAQLACLLGMEDTRDNSDPALSKYSSRVQAVVDFSGPTEFTTNHDPDGDAFLTSFLGATFSKSPEVWRDASPVFHVSKKSAPFLIFHGTKDANVPIAQAQELYDKLKEAKVPVSFVKVDDYHTLQTPEARRRLALESRDFFDQYLSNSH